MKIKLSRKAMQYIYLPEAQAQKEYATYKEICAKDPVVGASFCGNTTFET